ncbi:hypothetical protein [Compostimonas suwonensis]|uniref:Uncharacterized protein n=1 Tax=Compostimonas suwonensis TaxID=1048394 RepID=A0A2M9BZI1_9MICO|nr:hypothetical protein [Compostimonas suwonensis]PJJ63488.1 hypothetical protein CLV54_1156 [Compostimonas suwonensis]
MAKELDPGEPDRENSGLDEGTTPAPFTASEFRHRPAGQPPRPEMSDLTPAPVQLPTSPDGVIRVSRTLWLGSFVASLAAIAFVFLSRNTRIDRLEEFVSERAPDENASTVESVATVIMWASIAALGLFLIIQALLLHGITHRHGSVRWAMLVVLVGQIAATVVVDSFIATGDEGIYITAILLLQIVLACAALITSFLPGSRHWFRPDRQITENRSGPTAG